MPGTAPDSRTEQPFAIQHGNIWLRDDLSLAIGTLGATVDLAEAPFQIVYQPQTAFADGRLTGFEALLRWQHPSLGIVPPDVFIPIAEDMGLIDRLGAWVLSVACHEAASWPAPRAGCLRISVNVSPQQLRAGEELLRIIGRVLAQSGLPPKRLEIELTETAMAQDPSAWLRAIRAIGVNLALDDFGTGFSSLGRLRSHPFNRVKIDRSFVVDLGDEGATGQRARSGLGEIMVALGPEQGLATIVEGVEQPAQYRAAKLAGCSEVQGFLISPPVPASDVAQLIHRFDQGKQFFCEQKNQKTSSCLPASFEMGRQHE